MKKFSLDLNAIKEYQQNRYPYLMIDYADEILPGKFANGYKTLNEDEWFFKVHWPNDPNMPGMLQIESLVQMSALSILTLPNNKGKIMYLIAANKMKFIKKVLPNSKFYIKTNVKSYKRGIAIMEGSGYIDDKLVCKAEFSLILPDEIKKYSINL
jgi:3-hydroxyacyl-[acyl-carrier-protein] dehydratase